MSEYKTVLIETYKDGGKVRARPVAGQGIPTTMNVECSKAMRNGYEPGTKFKIEAKQTSREGGTPFLYSHHESHFEVLSDAEANAFIRGR